MIKLEQEVHHTLYFFPTVEITSYNVVIDDRNFINQSLENLQELMNIRKIATGQVDDYTAGYLL